LTIFYFERTIHADNVEIILILIMVMMIKDFSSHKNDVNYIYEFVDSND